MFACRQIAGIEDSPLGDPTSACGLPYGTGTCASCVATNCCSESTACAGDQNPVCLAYESCLGNCKGAPACRSHCSIDHPVGTANDVSALSACLAARCEKECGLTCGALAPSVSPPDAAAACQSCVESHEAACKSARSCGTSEACDAFWRCFYACPDVECQSECRLANDAGAALYDPFSTQYTGNCSTPCAVGNYWSCVGHASFPKPVSSAVTLTETLTEYPSGDAGAGVHLAVCTGCPCVGADAGGNMLLGEGTTDETGTVTIEHANPRDINGAGLNGCWELTSPDIVTQFTYWGFPLSGPRDVYGPAIATAVFDPLYAQNIASLGKVPQDPARGIVLFVTADCLNNQAPGVQVTMTPMDRDVSEFYGQGDLQATQTPLSGVGGFLDVPAGTHVLTATPMGLSAPSSIVRVNVQAGVITAASLVVNQ